MVNSQVNQFIQSEIEEMKNHGNIFHKLSRIHKRKIKPNSRLFEQFYLVGPSSNMISKRVDTTDMSFNTNGTNNDSSAYELRSPTFHYQYP